MNRLLSLLMLAAVVVDQLPTRGATIFESASLGETGLTFNDLVADSIPTTGVSETVFSGVRFHLGQPAVTSQIGGHFVARDNGSSIFGAVVRLTDENDFPNSFDLTTPDLIGVATADLPATSTEVFADLNVALNPGWYALVFGSGLFGAQGEGVAIRNGVDISDQSYIALQPQSGVPWVDLDSFISGSRFIVVGSIVPEPSTLTFLLIGLFAIAGYGGRS